MEIADPDEPMPEIPSIDEVAAQFSVRLATLVPQSAIRETGVSTMSSGAGGMPMALHAAALSYAVLWNPDDLDDPMNHVVLPPELEEAIANPEPGLPAGAVEWVRWARFRMAHEAVQTQMPGMTDQPLAERLALHMRNVVGNTFREERHPAVHEPDSFIDPPSARDAAPASVTVDGVETPAITIADEHVLGIGVELDDAVALVVFPRHLLPLVRVELTRRPRP